MYAEMNRRRNINGQYGKDTNDKVNPYTASPTFFLGTLPYGIVKREINSMDDCFDEMQEPLYGFRHSIYIRTVSSYCLLWTLQKHFKLKTDRKWMLLFKWLTKI